MRGTSTDVGRAVGGAVRSAGILCAVLAATAQCAPDEPISPLDPTEALPEALNSKGWWQSRAALRIVPNSLTIVAGDTRRASAEISSVEGDTVTISLSLIDKDSVVTPIEASEWSIDFDPTHLSISEDFLVAALAPTPSGSTTSVVVKHIDTELAAEVGVTILPDEVDAANSPGGWPNNEPAGMTPVLAADGSSKAWPGFQQYSGWQDDNRVAIVNDPDSKHGQAIEKRFFTGDKSGWHGLTSNGHFGEFRELYIRTVFKVSPNWQWHRSGGKYFYYGAAGRDRYVAPTQFVLGWEGDGTPFWIATRHGRHIAEGVPPSSRNVYHTIEIHHVASTDGANGSLRMWVDGVEVRSFTRKRGFAVETDVVLSNQEWGSTANMGDKRLSGIQAFLFWGGQNDTKRANDWIRLSELYISGKY